ncbi:MAG: dihydropteroate synthase [Planctomycetes bacterium]|nr:dihydropteroate synthase [Planctomycetota bacterium]
MDLAAALSADARRLEPRLAHVTEARAGVAAGFTYATVALRGERMTDDERAWLRTAEARREGLASWQFPLGELGLSLHTGVASLKDDHPLARLLDALAGFAARPRNRALVMGIVNVTSDSFSDGGRHLEPEVAIEHGLALVEQGADVLDVGGESTRPGSEPVDEALELARVVPVIRGLRARTAVPLSIDTQKAAVAAAALDAGATIVNDVSAGRTDPALLPMVAARGALCVLMHMQGTPRDMQRAPHYERDVVAEVLGFLRERAAAAVELGVAPERLVVDPGIGFGKRLEHNLALLRRARELGSLGLPVLIGASRKSFIADLERRMRPEGAPAPPTPPAARLGGSAAAVTLAVQGGASIVRVHDVRELAEAARIAFACSSVELDFPLA